MSDFGRKVNSVSKANYFNIVKPELTTRENQVLEALEEISPAYTEQVANHMNMFSHQISGRITALISKGKVERVKKVTNSRGVTAWLLKPVSNPVQAGLFERVYDDIR